MAYSVKVTSFLWAQADAAGTNYDVTLGFQPKIVIVWTSGRGGSADAVGGANIATAYGFGVSSSNRRSGMLGAADASANANYYARHSDAAILSLCDTSTPGGADSDGDLDIAAEAGWPADGIRFTVDTQINAAYTDKRVGVLALGGTDITAQNCFTFQEPASAGNQNVAHGLGATPTGALFLTVGLGSAPPVDAQTPAMFSVGATDGTRSVVLMVGGDQANTTMDTVSYCKSAEVIAMGSEPAVTLDGRAAFSSWDGTNIVLNWAERAATRYVFGLAWTGGAFRVDNLLTQTDTVTSIAESGYGFTPSGAMFLSACRTEDTADTPSAHAVTSVGAASGATERIAHGTMDEDALGTSETATAVEFDEVYVNVSTADAVQGLMDLTSFDSGGLTCIMDDADPAQSFVGVLAWGAAGGGATPMAPLPSTLTLMGVQ